MERIKGKNNYDEGEVKEEVSTVERRDQETWSTRVMVNQVGKIRPIREMANQVGKIRPIREKINQGNGKPG